MTSEQIAAREAELAAEREALAAERQALAAQQTQFAETARTARNATVAQFVAQLVTDGRVLPREQAGLVAFMQSLPADQVIEFGEGDAVQKPVANAWLQDFLRSLPPRVDYAERSAPAGEPQGGRFDAPAGAQVDPQRLALHNQALAYAEQNKVDYVTAVQAVSKEQ